jgi:radical SAM protein with 4Fe4S-binding SPASM domain
MRCNLRCSHCYCSIDRTEKELTTKQWKSIIDQIAAEGCIWLLITGGEPLLRPDFLEIYLHAKKRGLIITLFTNGVYMTEKIINTLVEYPPFVVEISLYGATEETYERVTGRKNRLASVIKTIEKILENNLRLKLKTVVMKSNVHELEKIKQLANSYSVDFRFDGEIFPKIDGNAIPVNERLDAESLAALEIFDKKLNKLWKDLYRKLKIDLRDSSSALQCLAGLTIFQINPYGNLQLCNMLADIGYNITSDNFKERWNYLGEAIKNFPSISKKCIGCRLVVICDQCPGWSYLESADYVTPSKYLCELAERRKFNIIHERRGNG